MNLIGYVSMRTPVAIDLMRRGMWLRLSMPLVRELPNILMIRSENLKMMKMNG